MSISFEAPAPVRARPRPLERVEAEIVSLSSQLAAATARLIELIGQFDAAEGWREWGMRSTAHWLSWQTGIGLNAAREQVRVARALPELPMIAAAFGEGRLSYSKVRALTRFAVAATDKELAAMGQCTTGSQIERLGASVRRARRASDVVTRRKSAYLKWHQDDDGSIVGSFRLAPEQAAVFCQGLDAARGRIVELTGEDDPADDSNARRARSAADALVAMAETYLTDVSAETSPEAAERFQLVLHTTAEGLAQPDDAEDDGPGSQLAGALGRVWRVAPSTARRLTCDCPTSTMTDGPDGAALHLGRKTRRIRGRLRRAVMHRDRGMCRAPGCTAAATQIHHLRHWAFGGMTCLANLVSLCDGHHWQVHEGGYSLAARDGGWVMISPDGVKIGPHPTVQPPSEPLPVDPSIASDAVTGHWDGGRLDHREIVGTLIAIDIQRPAPRRPAPPPAEDDVSAETWEPIDWPVRDDYPGEPWVAYDDPFYALIDPQRHQQPPSNGGHAFESERS